MVVTPYGEGGYGIPEFLNSVPEVPIGSMTQVVWCGWVTSIMQERRQVRCLVETPEHRDNPECG